jgi:hypothetical protein
MFATMQFRIFIFSPISKKVLTYLLTYSVALQFL